MVNDARVVVAAPASGHGKTTVATGLLAALRQRGAQVAPFKIGPDYVDPGYHRLACGRPGRNLDPVLVGEERIAPLFRHGSADAELSVIEGVMGLFDGRIAPTGGSAAPEGSTARVAELLAAPVVLVVDARGQGHSLAALLHGFRTYRADVRLDGVILNHVGSARHEQVLTDAAHAAGVRVLGAIPREEALRVPSRHLGLVTAVERGTEAAEAVEAMGEVVARSVDLEAVRALAAGAAPVRSSRWTPAEEVTAHAGAPVIAVAGGPAFTFGYPEHLELLEAAGARVRVVDPLHAEALPEGTAGLVLPGGFPEEHRAQLSANTALREEVARFAGAGGPVHAECGGLLYLGEELDGHPMCGALPARARMSERLTLGYRSAVAACDSSVVDEGAHVNGHEFHRTVLEPAGGDPPAWQWRDGAGRLRREGYVTGGVHASYLHVHPAGAPGTVERFVAGCAR
ncbi:cobyrinate a,c-diamide synthase [Salinifilum aidingensis]